MAFDRNEYHRQRTHTKKDWAWRRFVKTQSYELVYMKLVVDQEGKCAICKRELKLGGEDERRSPLDHCHKTGKLRGVLCDGCNIKLGAVDDTEWLEKALIYVRKFQ